MWIPAASSLHKSLSDLSASCKLAIIFSPRHVQNELELLASPCLHETTCSCMCTYVAPWNQGSQTQKTWQDQVIHQIWAISFQNLYPECFGVTSTVWSLEIAFHGIRSPTLSELSHQIDNLDQEFSMFIQLQGDDI